MHLKKKKKKFNIYFFAISTDFHHLVISGDFRVQTDSSRDKTAKKFCHPFTYLICFDMKSDNLCFLSYVAFLWYPNHVSFCQNIFHFMKVMSRTVWLSTSVWCGVLQGTILGPLWFNLFKFPLVQIITDGGVLWLLQIGKQRQLSVRCYYFK